MAGCLYLCATPIGNLKDITERVKETLSEVDLIAAEDTRNSIKILNHYEISTPMTSYHEHNKYEKADELIEKLKEGKNIALITDAGTPAISDPGEILVKKCMYEGLRVTSLPGACACITALTLSGLSTRRFCFEGFLPSEKKERRTILNDLAEESRTIILYESPHHLKNTLKELKESMGNRKMTLCRELTKKFETIFSTTIEEAIDYYGINDPRGEYVLVIEGKSYSQKQEEKKAVYLELTIEEHMALYEGKNMDRKEAMKQVAKERGLSKRDIYNYLCSSSKDSK